MTTLRPCPFCGSTDLRVLKGGPTLHDAVKCVPCNLFVPLSADEWNRRAAVRDGMEAAFNSSPEELGRAAVAQATKTPAAEMLTAEQIERIRTLWTPALNQLGKAEINTLCDMALASLRPTAEDGLVEKVERLARLFSDGREGDYGITNGAAREITSTLREAAAALSGRAGYVLVPIEPTAAMIAAGAVQTNEYPDRHAKESRATERAIHTYKAMLVAHRDGPHE